MMMFICNDNIHKNKYVTVPAFPARDSEDAQQHEGLL